MAKKTIDTKRFGADGGARIEIRTDGEQKARYQAVANDLGHPSVSSWAKHVLDVAARSHRPAALKKTPAHVHRARSPKKTLAAKVAKKPSKLTFPEYRG